MIPRWNFTPIPVTHAPASPQVDFPRLLSRVDEGFMTWRKPTALCFGSSDTFLPVGRCAGGSRHEGGILPGGTRERGCARPLTPAAS